MVDYCELDTATREMPTALLKKLPPVRILAVDDVEDNRFLVSHILRSAGFTVETAENGREAVAKALSMEFDLVLMDIQMPVMDGIEAVAELLNSGYQKPVVALTAHFLLKGTSAPHDLGFSGCLSKPYERTELLAMIEQLTKNQRS